MACSWILVDQAISLFYGLPPILNVSELQCRLPASERLWLPPNPEAWAEAWREEFGADHPPWNAMSHQSSLSLRDLFKLLVSGKLDVRVKRPAPLHMMLLLFPIQTLVMNFSQLSSCSSERGSSTTSIHLHSRELLFDDLQQLMHRWSQTFRRIEKRGFRGKAMAESALALYHVINLNLYTSFARLESFARRETSNESLARVSRWIRDPGRALAHCGRIFALFRGMGDAQQPIWSAGAIYRATIVLWAISISGLHGSLRSDKEGFLWQNLGKDDHLATSPLSGDSSLHGLFHEENGRIFLIGHDGQLVELGDPQKCIQLGVDAMRRNCPTIPFTVGVILKLEAMAAVWEQAR